MNTGEQEDIDRDDKNSYGENDIDIFMLHHSFDQIDGSESRYSARLT
jgi:hypothetical protein